LNPFLFLGSGGIFGGCNFRFPLDFGIQPFGDQLGAGNPDHSKEIATCGLFVHCLEGLDTGCRVGHPHVFQ